MCSWGWGVWSSCKQQLNNTWTRCAWSFTVLSNISSSNTGANQAGRAIGQCALSNGTLGTCGLGDGTACNCSWQQHGKTWALCDWGYGLAGKCLSHNGKWSNCTFNGINPVTIPKKVGPNGKRLGQCTFSTGTLGSCTGMESNNSLSSCDMGDISQQKQVSWRYLEWQHKTWASCRWDNGMWHSCAGGQGTMSTVPGWSTRPGAGVGVCVQDSWHWCNTTSGCGIGDRDNQTTDGGKKVMLHLTHIKDCK